MSSEASVEVFLGNGVALVPDDGFIFKTIEIEKKQSEKKIFDTISSEVAANFPFPIEQLAWGYLPLNTEKTKWLYFSGLRERIEGFVGRAHPAVCCGWGFCRSTERNLCIDMRIRFVDHCRSEARLLSVGTRSVAFRSGSEEHKQLLKKPMGVAIYRVER